MAARSDPAKWAAPAVVSFAGPEGQRIRLGSAQLAIVDPDLLPNDHSAVFVVRARLPQALQPAGAIHDSGFPVFVVLFSSVYVGWCYIGGCLLTCNGASPETVLLTLRVILPHRRPCVYVEWCSTGDRSFTCSGTPSAGTTADLRVSVRLLGPPR